mmetsp:Transcript_95183/g.274102  ORF Transcript_95183/g.274102 Transcript_95183/m.274102 type:complete len:211 (-) Transcript_95183:809-1441(-)
MARVWTSPHGGTAMSNNSHRTAQDQHCRRRHPCRCLSTPRGRRETRPCHRQHRRHRGRACTCSGRRGASPPCCCSRPRRYPRRSCRRCHRRPDHATPSGHRERRRYCQRHRPCHDLHRPAAALAFRRPAWWGHRAPCPTRSPCRRHHGRRRSCRRRRRCRSRSTPWGLEAGCRPCSRRRRRRYPRQCCRRCRPCPNRPTPLRRGGRGPRR